MKKNYTEYFHLYYKDDNYFSCKFLQTPRTDGVGLWDAYKGWEDSTDLNNLVPVTLNLENDSPYQVFENFHLSSFTSFFSTNLIDIPRCFKGVKSLYRRSHLVPMLKFTNLIMRHGKKEKVFQVLSNSATSYIKTFFRTQFLGKVDLMSWFTLFNTFSTFHITPVHQASHLSQLTELPLFNLHTIDQNARHDNPALTFHEMFFSQLEDIEPAFSFYVYKVNKSKRKNSRGKTGKYTLLWKYIAPFKRLYLTFRWLLKDVNFQKARNFNQRFAKFWALLHTNLLSSLAYKVKVFSHKFVFQNYRRTLLSSLRASL